MHTYRSCSFFSSCKARFLIKGINSTSVSNPQPTPTTILIQAMVPSDSFPHVPFLPPTWMIKAVIKAMVAVTNTGSSQKLMTNECLERMIKRMTNHTMETTMAAQAGDKNHEVTMAANP